MNKKTLALIVGCALVVIAVIVGLTAPTQSRVLAPAYDRMEASSSEMS